MNGWCPTDQVIGLSDEFGGAALFKARFNREITLNTLLTDLAVVCVSALVPGRLQSSETISYLQLYDVREPASSL